MPRILDETQLCARDHPKFQPLPTNLSLRLRVIHTNCTIFFQLQYSIDFGQLYQAVQRNGSMNEYDLHQRNLKINTTKMPKKKTYVIQQSPRMGGEKLQMSQTSIQNKTIGSWINF